MKRLAPLTGNRSQYCSSRNLVLLLAALPLAGGGFYIGVLPPIGNLHDWIRGGITSAQLVECVPGMLIGAVIGWPMVAVGWALAVLRACLIINPTERTLTRVLDFVLWRTTSEYLWADLARVVVECRERKDQVRRHYAHVSIVTSAHNQIPVSVEPLSRSESSVELGAELAEALGIPFDNQLDSAGLADRHTTDASATTVAARIRDAVVQVTSWFT